MIDSIRNRKASSLQKIKLLVAELNNVSPEFFAFEKKEMRGIQAIKKNLLRQKKFRFFSTIEVARKHAL